MWINYKSPTTTIPTEYDTLVANSNETYSVVMMGYDAYGQPVIYSFGTSIGDTFDTTEDESYIYEYYERYEQYWHSNMCICLRAKKNPKFDGEDIRLRHCSPDDFRIVYGGDMTNPSLYSDHNSQTVAFYWHGYDDGWCIRHDLPFKFMFPDRATGFDDYPNWIWHKVADELPYKVVFPTLFAIDDAPSALWKISDDLPFKSSFAPRYRIDDAPIALWIKQPDGLPYKIVFPKMPKAPVMEKVYEGERQTIIVPNYNQTVILSAYRQQVIVEDYEL